MHKTIVDLGSRSYPIYLGSETLQRFPEAYHSLDLSPRAAIVTDTHVANIYLKRFASILRQHGIGAHTIVIPPGERQKSLTGSKRLYAELVRQRFTRSDTMIAFGGGVVGDLTGFVAATYRRGIAFVQVPTTFLAQVESAIGGKTGINHPMSKNAIGAFHQPQFVFSDVNMLSTLPRREILCGLGEVIKYGYLDVNIFEFLEQHLEDILKKDIEMIQEVILRCNAMKAKMISEDERETNATGGRMVLNLGHTIGQALEVLSSYRLRHGEAVLIGLEWELMIAEKAQLIAPTDAARIQALLERVGFQPRLRFFELPALLKKLFSAKSKPRFVLPKTVGEVVVTNEIGESLVRSVLKRIARH